MQEEIKIEFQNEDETVLEYEEITQRLDRLDEKAEFVRAEVAQRTGRKIGRDVGILYGVLAALILASLFFILINYFS
ncbi:tetrahydromethanopterin S-methyltransferase subunit MtrG [Methanimicrococcus blatticola]|uniref:Tetrahydromethanopterin S-methyltransferase subunit G n=1 Tax=Methanimicrococcus blatticola TaxID=91560 RepID=A0A484F4V6_9EURY|nr:tetrahydromethanopterin S-methyltransferase subunit G [Methanimicrococcus blatticola]MBZ3936117.1 tetrahydromethanopterin S-methyltransferase subunit G [Methanimicrococcus blatticola]MCC2508360.1 tetrahydromethanopterin S-methyltransferase subunit G [Methanimicrococcus blatticola]TDQ70187.1 tetrahydromethanopterin S-methyltransferase subunit G [Methanimicrococcus blatticola]